VNFFEITLRGMESFPDFAHGPEKIAQAARRAINKTADYARTQGSRAILDQVNFPASYLRGANSRLYVKKRSVGDDLEAIITGRERPTSLARFAKQTDAKAVRKRGGLDVEVKPGQAQFLKGAFLVKLRAGSATTDTQFNIGVAIRFKPGQSPRNSRAAVQLDHNVWLLYGPSVNQVFNTVREDISPEATEYLQKEFFRQLDLDQ
jgi:hypothetical protein